MMWIPLAILLSGFAVSNGQADDFSLVTCGSALKLKHKASGYRLHSHTINWGSGSGQQSVTAFESGSDPNSLWLIKEAYGTEACKSGSPVKCNSQIRLQHLSTKRHLHSHLHTAPLSKKQEVSGFGDDNGSDTGDNFLVVCAGEFWNRDKDVQLQHVDTGKWLFTGKDSLFTQGNCFNCPIIGQLEVACQEKQDKKSVWVSDEGYYVANAMNSSNHSHDDDHDHDHSHDQDHDHEEL